MEKTLDSTQDAFRDNPTVDSAMDYLWASTEYWRDGMIEDSTLDAIYREILGRFCPNDAI